MPRRHANPIMPDFDPSGNKVAEGPGTPGRAPHGDGSFYSEVHEGDASFLGNSVHSLSQALRTYDVDSLDNSRNVFDSEGANHSHRYSFTPSLSAYDGTRRQDSDINVRLEASPGHRRGRNSGRSRETDSEYSYHGASDAKLNSSTQKVFMNFINSSFSGKHDTGSQPPPTPRAVYNTSFSKGNNSTSFGMMPASSSSMMSAPQLQNSMNGNVVNGSVSRWSKSLSADESQATLTASLRRDGTSFSQSTVPLIKPHHHVGSGKSSQRGSRKRGKSEASMLSKDDMSKMPSLQEPIPFPFFIEQMRTRMKFNDGLQDIVIFTIFAIFMCFFATYHPSGIERMYYVSASLFEHFSQQEFPLPQRQIDTYRQRLYFFNTSSWVNPDKYYADISNHLDWRWYVTDVLLESFITPFHALGNVAGLDLNTTTIGEAYGQMFGVYPVGALRIRTIRMADYTCKLQESLYPSVVDYPDVPRDCWRAGTTRKYEETNATLCPSIMNPLKPNESLFQYHKPSHRFGTTTIGIDATYHDGGYYCDIPFSSNVSVVQQFQTAFANLTCNFVDSWATRLAVFSMFFYAPATDTWHRVEYRSEVKVTGWHLNSAVQRPFEVFSYRMRGQVVFTGFVLLIFVFFCAILIYQGVYLFKVDHELFKARVRSIFFYVDLLLVGATTVIFVFWFRWLHDSVQIRDKLQFPFDDESLPDSLSSIQSNYEVFSLMCAIDLLLIGIRLVRLYELWAPLLIITQSLLSDTSIKMLISICVMFVISFIGFAFGGWAMFGCYSEQFETISSSFMYLMQLNFGFNTSYPLISGNQGAFFLFLLSYHIIQTVMFTCSVIATLSWTFTTINSKYFLAYDMAWFGCYIRSLWKTLRWYRIRRVLRVLFGMQRETQYLNEICDLLESYVHEKLQQDTRKSMIHLSVSYPSSLNTAPTPSPTIPPSTVSGTAAAVAAAAAADKDVHDESQPLLETSTNTTSAAAAAAATAAAAEMAKLREELADNDYTFKRLSTQSYKITFQQLLELVPPRLYTHCGGLVFFTDLWRETVESLHDFRQTPAQLEIRARRACTKDLTMKVMNQELLKIEKLNTTIYHLETHIANLRSALQVHNMSFVDDDE